MVEKRKDSKTMERPTTADGTDAFDTLYISAEKFPYRDSFALSMSDVV